MPSIGSVLSLKPQARTILAHLHKHGHISPAKAGIVYGISRLAACIYEIREIGHEIKTHVKQDEQGHRYAKYVLVK